LSLERGAAVPEEWGTAKIAELFESWGGMTPSKANAAFWGDGVPWASSQDIKSARLSRTTHSVTQRALDETRLRVCPVGTVLVVVRSGILAHTLPVTVTDVPVVINQDLKAFDSGDRVLNEWLAAWLRAGEREILGTDRRDGTTVQSVQYSMLKQRVLPVPPPDEQRRILARLHTIGGRRASIVGRLAAGHAIVDRLRVAVVGAACSGRLTADWRSAHQVENVPPGPSPSPQAQRHGGGAENSDAFTQIPESWGWWSVESITSTVIDYRGRTPPSSEAGTIPHVRTTQLREGRIDWNVDRFVTVETYDRYMTRGLPQRGDVLFTMEAPLGEVGVVDVDYPFSIAQRILLLRPGGGITGDYLALALRSPAVWRAIELRSTGSGVLGIAYKRLRSVLVPKPPLEEQLEIVRQAHAALKTGDEVAAALSSAEDAVARSVRAAAAAAFRGELVAVDDPELVT
jgi:type I restriction enzyme S subunit